MRLQTIEVEGFQTYRERCVLDLSGVNLGVIVGPNGAGKSTIVCDAVVFALFGQVRTDTLHEVISTGLDYARVSVTFELDEGLYRVDRKLPRRGKHEATFLHATATGWTPLTEHTVSHTNAAIVARLGMTYETCMATVFAVQGDAGRFTGACGSAERRAILASVLNLDAWAPRHADAKASLADAIAQRGGVSTRIDQLEHELARIGPTDQETLDQAEVRVGEASAAAEEAARQLAALPDREALLAELARLERERTTAAAADERERESLGARVRDADRRVADRRRHLADLTGRRGHATHATGQAEAESRTITRLNRELTRAAARLSKIMADGQGAASELSQVEERLGALAVRETELNERLATLRQSVSGEHGHCHTCHQVLSVELARDLADAVNLELRALRADVRDLRGKAEAAAGRRSALRVEHRDVTGLIERHREVLTASTRAQAAAQAVASTAPALDKEILQETALLAEATERLEAVRAAQRSYHPQHADAVNARIGELTAQLPDQEARVMAAAAVRRTQQNLGMAMAERTAVVSAAARASDLASQIKMLHTRAAEHGADVEIYTLLRDAYGPTGIPALILNGVIDELNRDVQEALTLLSHGELTAELQTERATKAGDIASAVHLVVTGADGTPRSYKSFSGGQQFRVDLALRVGLANLMARRSGTEIKTLLIDEGLAPLDDDGIRDAAHTLQVLAETVTVLVITHRLDVQDLFPTIISVADRGGTTFATRRT